MGVGTIDITSQEELELLFKAYTDCIKTKKTQVIDTCKGAVIFRPCEPTCRIEIVK